MEFSSGTWCLLLRCVANGDHCMYKGRWPTATHILQLKMRFETKRSTVVTAIAMVFIREKAILKTAIKIAGPKRYVSPIIVAVTPIIVSAAFQRCLMVFTSGLRSDNFISLRLTWKCSFLSQRCTQIRILEGMCGTQEYTLLGSEAYVLRISYSSWYLSKRIRIPVFAQWWRSGSRTWWRMLGIHS